MPAATPTLPPFQHILASNQYTLEQIDWHPHHDGFYGSDGDAKQWLVNGAFFANCPSVYTTPRLMLKKSHHIYDNFFRSELLRLSATPSLCTSLAMLCLQAVFTQQTVTIDVSQRHSDVDAISFDCHQTHPHLDLKPVQWCYQYQPVAEFLRDLRQQHMAFALQLSTVSDSEFAHPDKWLSDRRQLCCHGDAHQLTQFAALLLNFAHPHAQANELVLESAVGMGGVSTGSCELEICLPTSLGYLLNDHALNGSAM